MESFVRAIEQRDSKLAVVKSVARCPEKCMKPCTLSQVLDHYWGNTPEGDKWRTRGTRLNQGNLVVCTRKFSSSSLESNQLRTSWWVPLDPCPHSAEPCTHSQPPLGIWCEVSTGLLSTTWIVVSMRRTMQYGDSWAPIQVEFLPFWGFYLGDMKCLCVVLRGRPFWLCYISFLQLSLHTFKVGMAIAVLVPLM